jgi:ribosomal protein S18 acetylase RimI-like enzyme
LKIQKSNKLKDRYLQFGIIAIIWRFFKRLLQPLVYLNTFNVLVVPEHIHNQDTELGIQKISKQKIQDYFANGELLENQREQLLKFLDEGCYGYFAKTNHGLAGFAIVQNNGIYSYSVMGKFDLRDHFGMLKNLYVFPSFRGKSIGKKLNFVRISGIEENKYPIGFVVGDNKYAIRNLELNGFEKTVKIKTYIFFRKFFIKRIVRDYRRDYLSELVIKSFIN